MLGVPNPPPLKGKECGGGDWRVSLRPRPFFSRASRGLGSGACFVFGIAPLCGERYLTSAVRCLLRFNRRERFADKPQNGRRPDVVALHRGALPLSAITAVSVSRTSRETDGGLVGGVKPYPRYGERYLLRFYRPALLLIVVALASSLFRPSYGQPTWCESEGWLRFVRRTA